jgi:hypothetical protein
MMQDRRMMDQSPSQCRHSTENKTMLKKILICAVIALILVPASVMAAGFGGKGTAAASGQGQCLQDGLNCQTGQQGAGIQAHYCYGAQQNGANGATGSQCSGNGQCDTVKNQTRSMLRLHDGTGTACKNNT